MKGVLQLLQPGRMLEPALSLYRRVQRASKKLCNGGVKHGLSALTWINPHGVWTLNEPKHVDVVQELIRRLAELNVELILMVGPVFRP